MSIPKFAPQTTLQFINRWALVAAVATASVLAAGCGGSGGGEGSAAPAPTVGVVTGTAATGAPIVGGSVQMICVGGTASTAVTTDANGTYTIPAGTSGALPCIVKVTGGSGNSGTLYSLVQTGQTVTHINQLTHMLAYSLAGGDPATFFTTPSNISTMVTAAKVSTQKAIVQTVVAALATAMGIPADFDFLSAASFGSVGVGFDRLLDNITFSTTASGGTATAPVIIFKGTNLAILTINAATGAIVGSAPAVIAAASVVDLSGLKLFATLLQTRLFGNTATFTNPLAGYLALSDVLGSSLSAGTSNAVFTLISSGNTGGGVRINPDLVALASLTPQHPTLGSVLSGGVNFLRVLLNYTNTAGTLTAKGADVERVIASPTATAAAWRLNDLETTPAKGPAPVVLGTAGNFVILAKTAVTTTGVTAVTGDIGVSPAAATTITGFGLIADSTNVFSTSSLVTGKVFAANMAVPTPTNLTTAVSDMETAFTSAAGRTNPASTELGAGNIGGMTLAPGLYKWSSNVTIPTDVTLSGASNDVWIFQIAGDLSIASGGSVAAGIKVNLTGGAKASNVFWQVGGGTGATLGTFSTFNGNILSAKQIILQNGAVLNGRALAQTQVTLIGNTVTKP